MGLLKKNQVVIKDLRTETIPTAQPKNLYLPNTKSIIRGGDASSGIPIQIENVKEIIAESKPLPQWSNPPEELAQEGESGGAAGFTEMAAIVPKIEQETFHFDEKKIQEEISKRKHHAEQELESHRRTILAEIEIKKKKIFEDAYQKGMEIGKKEGEKEAILKARELLGSINEMALEKTKILKKSRGEILKLAIKIAEQIIRSEISLNQAVCINIVAEAIGKITDKDKVIIRASRSDSEFLKMNQERIMAFVSDIKNLIIQEDSRIQPGGCVIETDMGYIDATITTKVESIQKALMKTYEEELQEEEMAASVEPVSTESAVSKKFD